MNVVRDCAMVLLVLATGVLGGCFLPATPFEIVSISPAEDAADVLIDAAITATASVAFDAATVTVESVQLI